MASFRLVNAFWKTNGALFDRYVSSDPSPFDLLSSLYSKQKADYDKYTRHEMIDATKLNNRQQYRYQYKVCNPEPY